MAGKIDYRKGKAKEKTYVPIVSIIQKPKEPTDENVYAQKDALVKLCERYKEEICKLYKELAFADDDEKEIVYEKISARKEEQKAAVEKRLTSEYVLYLFLRHYDKRECENWHIYAPILENPLFISMRNSSKERLKHVCRCADGEYVLYGKNYTKK